MTKEEKQELDKKSIDYIKAVINEDGELDKVKKELVLEYIYNILSKRESIDDFTKKHNYIVENNSIEIARYIKQIFNK